MDFVKESLRQTEQPDPLWLYKVGTSLIKAEADRVSKTRDSNMLVEARLLLKSIDECIAKPERIPYESTALEPLIAGITEEFVEFDDIFDLSRDDFRKYREAGGERSYKEYLHDQVATAVLKAYKNSGLFLHLHHVGDISDTQLQLSAALCIQELNKYGANGLEAMLASWDMGKHKGQFFGALINDNRKIIPEKVCGVKNDEGKSLARKEFYEREKEYAAPDNNEAVAAFDKGMFSRLLGHKYHAARDAKEELVAQHIKSGVKEFGDDIMVTASALHPNYDRARDKAFKYKKSKVYAYQDEDLELKPAELENIRNHNDPKSLHELIDATFGKEHPARLEALNSVRLLQAGGIDSSTESTSEPRVERNGASKAENLIQLSDARQNNAHSATSTEVGVSSAGDKSDSTEKQGWVTAGKVGTALLGSVLVADQYRRANKKDEESEGKSEKKSKVINYVLGAAAAAGVAVVVFTKPEKLVKFVEDISKFLGKGSSGKSI